QYPEVFTNTAWEGLLERKQPDAPVVGKLRGLYFFQIRDNRPQIKFGLRFSDARFQSSEQMRAANALDRAPALESDRKIDSAASPHKPLRHDPDHRADLIVQTEPPSNDVRIAYELSLPESVTEHDHRIRLRSGVIRQCRPSNERRHAHHLKGVERAVIPS